MTTPTSGSISVFLANKANLTNSSFTILATAANISSNIDELQTYLARQCVVVI